MLRSFVAKRRHCSFFSLLLLAFAPVSRAQTTTGWDRVKQLPPGSEIRLNLSGGRTVTTAFQGATDDAIMVAKAAVQETMGRPMIVKVSFKGNSHRGRHALIGLGIGAGAGLVTGAVIDSQTSCVKGSFCLNFLPNAGKEVLTPLGAIVGTLVGAFIPSGAWREIYHAK